MAYTPGELLVQGGAITAQQHRRALARRDAEGGSIGENVIALGFMGENELAAFYHKRLLVPLVEPARFQNVSAAALKLIPAELAAEFRVVPISVEDDGSLLVALADPADNHAVEEIGFFVDCFVIRAVAAESVIRSAIARYYPSALVAEPPLPPVTTPRASFIDAPPMELLPRTPPPLLVERPVEKPEEPVHLLTHVKEQKTEPGKAKPPAPRSEPVHILTDKIGKERTGTLAGVQPSGRRVEPARVAPAAVMAPSPNAPAPVAALRAARDREAVAELLIDYAAQLLGRAVLFVVSKGTLRGYRARGGGLDHSTVEVLQIPLAGPSVFRDVVRSRLAFHGFLPSSPQSRAVSRVLGIGDSTEAVLLPIVVGERVVAVLFGCEPSSDIPESALQLTLYEAGLAYQRLIYEARRAAPTDR